MKTLVDEEGDLVRETKIKRYRSCDIAGRRHFELLQIIDCHNDDVN